MEISVQLLINGTTNLLQGQAAFVHLIKSKMSK